jgi:hypothetical protein
MIWPLLLLALALPPQPTDEKPVDAGSTRVSLEGCLRGRNLIVIEPAERPGEPVKTVVAPGRVFRLSGPKSVMQALGRHDKTAVEVTGLVRKNALDANRGGLPIGAGGRIRIGGMPMGTDPTGVDPRRDPLANVDLLDVEAFRPVDAVCPTGRR